MTEAEWIASTDPAAMLAWRIDLGRQSLYGVPTYTAPRPRKLRLFACACCRQVWHLLTDERSRQAVEVAERYVDGQATADELAAAGVAARAAARDEHTALLRCIIGNPFQVTLQPESLALEELLAWNNSTIPRLAQAIYDERAFERMPILADALEDAGCDNEDILGHLRGPGPHARGCFVLDLLLGKE